VIPKYRLELLAVCFAVSVCGFAVMDNLLHVLVRLDPDEAARWSDAEVVRRWIKVYPPKTLKGDEIEINQAWVDHQLKDAKRVAAMRDRLASENSRIRSGSGSTMMLCAASRLLLSSSGSPVVSRYLWKGSRKPPDESSRSEC